MAVSSSSTARAFSIIVVASCVVLLCSATAPRLGGSGSVTRDVFLASRSSASQLVSASQVQRSLSDSLEVLLQGGQGSAARHLARIEGSLWKTFEALPKNVYGRLAPRAVRYIVHNYFAKEHGWLIEGLEPHAHRENVNEVHEVGILQDKAPALVEALLEARQSDRGLALSDVVAMAASLEWLILEESMELLQSAYALNGQSPRDHVDETMVHEVLLSYLIVLEQGGKANTSDVRRHEAVKAGMKKSTSSSGLGDYEYNAVLNFAYRTQFETNPFVPHLYSFEATSRIVEDMARGYGKWQNSECHQMKNDLMELVPDDSGLVPLSVFYSQPNTAAYQFSESLEYLRKVGALDESVRGSPKVRIANYLAGPSNCISTSRYYSVCCLSECEHLLNELEEKMRAPMVALEPLLRVVRNLSSSTVDAPRQLSEGLTQKLTSIANRNAGQVPLHGRLFAQWLHFAFPNECPFPHVAEDTATLTPGHWLEGKAASTAEERKRHTAQDSSGSESEAGAESDGMTEFIVGQPISQWIDDEVLPLQEEHRPRSGLFGSYARVAVQLALCVVLLRMVYAGWIFARAAGDERIKKGREGVHFV